jgi:peptidoglycan-associated lipoprotein
MTRGIVRTTLAVALFAGLLAGCATPAARSYVTLLQSPDGTVGKVLVQGEKGEQLITQARYSAVNEAQFNRDFGEAIAARPALPQHFLLYFETGGTQLTAESQAQLPHILELAAQSPMLDMSIIGHTDTMGAADFNTDISLQRAQVVAELMKSQGLKIHTLTVESHGERNLLVPTPDETPEPRNRRVEITLR